MKHLFKEETREFTAKIICDLGKNIVSIGFASYFFKDLPLPLRVGIGILGMILIASSIWMFSTKGERKWS